MAMKCGGQRGACHPPQCRRALGVLLLAILCSGMAIPTTQARPFLQPGFFSGLSLPSTMVTAGDGRSSSSRTLSTLVEPPLTILTYHNGPLLSGPANSSIPVYIIWYGSFNESGKEIIRDFFASFAPPLPAALAPAVSGGEPMATVFPSVRTWWNLTAGYVDTLGDHVSPSVHLAGEMNDSYSLGKAITEAQVGELVLKSLSSSSPPGLFPVHSIGAYFVLTAEDVSVETFCSVCGSHFSSYPSPDTSEQQVPYAWVGNSVTQCPGQCAWPFAAAQYGPPLQLLSPNGDVGIDGMIINIATLLAGMATDPFNTGYYQGDALAPLEAASACAGIYGVGAYPGNPGALFQSPATNGSFNAVGVNQRGFLLPALWLPSNQTCTPPPLPTM